MLKFAPVMAIPVFPRPLITILATPVAFLFPGNFTGENYCG